MSIKRSFILAIACTCLLATISCRPVLVAVPPRPPAPAPVPAYHHVQHRYHYYPQEQVYFDPGRRVYFYLDGPNWRVAASLPRWIQLSYSDYVVIEMDHDKPYREFGRHRSLYPKHHKRDRHQPRHPAYKYRYYPQEQVYFDPGRRVYFYRDGRNWRMVRNLPRRMRLNHSDYVPIEMDHDSPYREFKKHKKMYPGKSHKAWKQNHEDKREGFRRDLGEHGNLDPRRIHEDNRSRMASPAREHENSDRDMRNRDEYSHGRKIEQHLMKERREIEREKPRRDFAEHENVNSRRTHDDNRSRVAFPAKEHENSDRDMINRNGYPYGRNVEQQPSNAHREMEREKPRRDFAEHGNVNPRRIHEENKPRTASPAKGHGNSNHDARNSNKNTQDKQVGRKSRPATPEKKSKKGNKRFAAGKGVNRQESQKEEDQKMKASEADPEKSEAEEEENEMDSKKKNNKNKNKKKK